MSESFPNRPKAGFRAKQQRDRSKVRRRMKELRIQIQDLEIAQQNGEDNSADLMACRGEMQVLKKEIQSIDEGGHTTFVAAKEMLAPKKDMSKKNRSIQDRRMQFNNRIAKIDANLEEPNLGPEDREALLTEKARLQDDLAALVQEKQALQEFNHTRFVQFRKEKVDSDKQADKLKGVNAKIARAEEALDQAKETGDAEQVNTAKEDLHLLLMEKESIENYTHDLFLQNLVRMKAKHERDLL